jgi:hypothetical protein
VGEPGSVYETTHPIATGSRGSISSQFEMLRCSLAEDPKISEIKANRTLTSVIVIRNVFTSTHLTLRLRDNRSRAPLSQTRARPPCPYYTPQKSSHSQRFDAACHSQSN